MLTNTPREPSEAPRLSYLHKPSLDNCSLSSLLKNRVYKLPITALRGKTHGVLLWGNYMMAVVFSFLLLELFGVLFMISFLYHNISPRIDNNYLSFKCPVHSTSTSAYVSN